MCCIVCFLGTFSLLDCLLYLGHSTMEALIYYRPEARISDATPLDLHDLTARSQRIFAGDAATILPLLLQTGGSPGGARPKMLVGWKREERFLFTRFLFHATCCICLIREACRSAPVEQV
jgi:serine/threonine-protein kinase HipA